MQLENYIVDIVRSEMGLDQNHIWVRVQNRKIPPNADELFVVVGAVDFNPISSKSYYDSIKDAERQVVYGRALVQIDIFSRSIEARTRRAEVSMALNSFYSQEIQNKYQFRIFEIPSSFINTSGLEGGSDINRYTLRFYAMCSEVKEKTTAYYDTFNAEINSDGTEIILDTIQAPRPTPNDGQDDSQLQSP
jgi:hypothetical protein